MGNLDKHSKTLGDDESMIPTTIEELRADLGSWICLKSGGKLDSETVVKIKADVKEPFYSLAFKIMTDPFVGILNFVRVYSGELPAE